MANIIKGSTSKGQRVMYMYASNIGYYLDDVYGRYSAAKAEAWRECLDWYKADNESSNFHICSKNDSNFTVGWRYIDPDTKHKMIRVETSRHTYIVDTEA